MLSNIYILSRNEPKLCMARDWECFVSIRKVNGIMLTIPCFIYFYRLYIKQSELLQCFCQPGIVRSAILSESDHAGMNNNTVYLFSSHLPKLRLHDDTEGCLTIPSVEVFETFCFWIRNMFMQEAGILVLIFKLPNIMEALYSRNNEHSFFSHSLVFTHNTAHCLSRWSNLVSRHFDTCFLWCTI